LSRLKPMWAFRVSTLNAGMEWILQWALGAVGWRTATIHHHRPPDRQRLLEVCGGPVETHVGIQGECVERGRAVDSAMAVGWRTAQFTIIGRRCGA
jgi:hypothetical protein